MKKALTIIVAIILVVALSVAGTVAYLTSTDKAVNTFTVGKVNITLTEPKWDENANKLIPGNTIPKDPTVTVKANSEDCYVRLFVTVEKSSQLDTIFAPSGATLISIFDGYNGETWLYQGNTEDTEANTRTYEFWYKEVVPASTTDTKLAALFTSVTVPNDITKEQLATIDGLNITVVAQAIQAAGSDDADAAWAKW